MGVIKLEDIQSILKQDNWKLISTEYHNLDEELIFECEEGHRVYSNWKKIRVKRECPTCKQNELKQISSKIINKNKNTKRVIALDQATRVSGYSIWDNGKLIKYGTFETQLDDEIARCNAIKTWLISLINEWKPDKIGFEGIQFQTYSNGKHSMGITVFETLAHLQGILMETCYDMNVPYEVAPTNTWRAYCGVKGQARTDKKRSMQNLVKQWYDIGVTEDEADAIGIGKYFADKYMKNIIVENWE